MNLAQKVAFNTTTQLVGEAAGVLISLLTLHVTTAYLGVDGFGELAIVLAMGALVVTISELGVTTTLARELATTPEDTDRIAASLLRFRLISAVGLVLATLAIIPFLPYAPQTKVALVIYLVGVFAQSVATFPKAFFQTQLRLHLQAAIEFSTRTLTLVAVSLVAVLDLGFYALVGSLAAVGLARLAMSFWLLLRFWRPSLRWERELGRGLVRASLGIGISMLIGLLHFRGDAILISLLAPARDVGIYAVAYRFIDQALVLPGLLIGAVFPILTRLVNEGPGRVDETINRAFQVLGLASISLTIAILTLAKPIVLLVAGEGFEPAVRPARILAFSLPFIFCLPVFHYVVIAVNRQRWLIWAGLASLTLNVAMNLALIPRFTYNGAAVATVVSEGVAFTIAVVIARRSVAFKFDALFLGRAALAIGAAAVAAALVWPISEILAFVAAELALAAAAFASGAVRMADIRLIIARSDTAGRA